MRNLTISDSINLGGCKEFNHLRIRNMDEFLSSYTNRLDYYAPPFKILCKLEEAILFSNNPRESVLVKYKPDGDIIFYFVDIKEEGELRIVTYEYAGSIS